MESLADHLLLALAVCALGAAALRVAALAAATPAMTILAAAALATATAVAHALLLGTVGLGASPGALTAAATTTWLLCRRVVPGQGPPLRQKLAHGWRRLGPGGRVALGAGVGMAFAWTAWMLRYPLIGDDGLLYHLTDIATWVSDGAPGSRHALLYGVPVEAYPKTTEVTLTWAAGIARSMAVIAPFMVAMLGLVALSCFAGLRSAGIGRRTCILAAAVLATLPIAIIQLGGPNTDLPALAWLTCAAALAAGTRRSPALAGPALVAAALAAGTKTTALPLALLICVLALWAARGHLRALRPALVTCAGLGLGVGGIWYLRNLIDHGSPVWPFVAGPFGDGLPEIFERFGVSFIERPGASVEGREDLYAEVLGGGLFLLVGVAGAIALLGAFRDPSGRWKGALAASLVAVAATLMWANAPFTGASTTPGLERLVIGGVRYMLPALAACVVALALATKAGRAARTWSLATLALALLANLDRFAGLSFPQRPGTATLVLGGAAGGLLALAFPLGRLIASRGVPVGLALLAAVLLTPLASGFVSRHAEVGLADAPVVRFLLSQPGFADGDEPVAMAPATIAVLAGDRFSHRLELIGQDEACPKVRARIAEGWVIVGGDPGGGVFGQAFSAPACLQATRPVFVAGDLRVYALRRRLR